MKKGFVIIGALSISLSVCAQQPFKEYGYEVPYMTLSNGKYQEFHDQDTIVRIGKALFNTQSMAVIGFVVDDTLRSEAFPEPEIVSRWLSPDPLTPEYPSLSPYNYVAGNPIVFVDTDGREIVIHGKVTTNGKAKLVKLTYNVGDQAPNGASQFLRDTYQALNSLVEDGVGNHIVELSSKDIGVVRIKESNKGSVYNSTNKTIKFNTRGGIISGEFREGKFYYDTDDNTTIFSPARALSHEAGHAKHDLIDGTYAKDFVTAPNNPENKTREEEKTVREFDNSGGKVRKVYPAIDFTTEGVNSEKINTLRIPGGSTQKINEAEQ